MIRKEVIGNAVLYCGDATKRLGHRFVVLDIANDEAVYGKSGGTYCPYCKIDTPPNHLHAEDIANWHSVDSLRKLPPLTASDLAEESTALPAAGKEVQHG